MKNINDNNETTYMKKYIKPSIHVTDVELQNMMAGSEPQIVGESKNNQIFSNSRRGNWGNLWDDED